MSAHDWPEVELQDLTSKIGSGATPKGGKGAYRSDGIPLIRSMNVHDLTFVEEDLAFIGEQQAQKLDNVKTQSGDVLLNITGASVARCCYLPNEFAGGRVNQHVAIIRPEPTRLDGRFLTYLLVSGPYKGQLLSIAGAGATREALTKGGLERFRIPTPPLAIQQRIAAIIGAYDDLIEVNRRRVTVLEEMARRLFDEWFVRFRFPGHEDVPIVDTPDGPLPEGWEYGPLKNVLSLRSGFAFKSSTFVDDAPYSIVTIKHVHDGLLKPPFASKVSEPPKQMPEHCKIKEGDILVSLTGNVGRTCLAWGEDLLLNQRVAKVDPLAKHYRAFAYCWFRSTTTLQRLQNIANGAAQQNLSPVQTVSLTIPIPPTSVAIRFEAVVHPILQSVVLVHRSNAVLRGQRDLLLPRLISGQLSVEAAELQLENAA